jgi:hypothetical protein
MTPFRNFGPVVPPRRCPSGRCAVCCSGPAQVCQLFLEMVTHSWSKLELEILRKAAQSALL